MLKYFLLFIPSILCSFISNPNIAYILAWLGSIYLISISIYTCKFKLKEQIDFFSPIVLSQCLFWGYTAITSIFYFLDLKGYQFFEKISVFQNTERIILIAKAQIYILFAHACYLTGYYLVKARTEVSRYKLCFKDNTYFKLSIFTTILGLILSFTFLRQLSPYLTLFSTLCAVRYFGLALKKNLHIPIATIYLAIILVTGFLTGMKENTVYPMIFLGIIIYERFGILKTSIVFVPIMAIYLYFIPTYNSIIRESKWYGNKSTMEIFEDLSSVNIDDELLENNNWTFLTTRLSEISMFADYLESVPEKRPFYDFEIVGYGLAGLVPRFIWPDKPSPDATAQQRAVDNGVLTLNSSDDFTSAKPQTIVDAYLSNGYLGILITFILFGAVVKIAYNLLYGKLGYEFGVTILFYSLFSILSRGGCFENLFNTIIYGFVLFYIFLELMKKSKLISN